jgi:hypothetical protein
MRWSDLRIYAADIGSISRGNFGWARSGKHLNGDTDTSIDSLVRALAEDLKNRNPVALGIEAPLFVPVQQDYRKLGKKREADPSNRAWSAGAGAPVMATGIAQLNWIIRALVQQVDNEWTANAGVRWEGFSEKGGPGLFLWEAMVTGSGKKSRGDSHHNMRDAEAAAEKFDGLKSNGVRKLDKIAQRTPDQFSLVGAVLAANLGIRNLESDLLTQVPIVVEVD